MSVSKSRWPCAIPLPAALGLFALLVVGIKVFEDVITQDAGPFDTAVLWFRRQNIPPAMTDFFFVSHRHWRGDISSNHHGTSGGDIFTAHAPARGATGRGHHGERRACYVRNKSAGQSFAPRPVGFTVVFEFKFSERAHVVYDSARDRAGAVHVACRP